MPELRLPNAAAQTRMVSGGEFWPIQRELSRHLKYIARVRIPEFESDHPSQAAQSLGCDFRGENRRHSGGLIDTARWFFCLVEAREMIED
jgi:hypothetical protein